ncbi:ABC transporter permease [Seongchinamella unica]|uniref:ABC transporter permease n=1 Tax=Seongchinamella unica TaxID=2547392 RepID=A0A4R5LTC0_9GAMM|nr:ABC transporter permease [Seongchinamella unica]TDG14192.1 ABC transporter permease [Seongchinamella unica]
MIRNVAILAGNDLAIGVKNKTLYLILFIPLFVFLVLRLVDGDKADFAPVNIGLLEGENYSPAMIHGLQSAERVFTISWLPDENAAKQWLGERLGDGILIPSAAGASDCALIVLEKTSLQTVAIVESVTALQRSLEGGSGGWIAEIRPLRESKIQRQMLPTWILVLVLMVGFIVLPSQVAEEKEKKLLLGLLQTPVHEVEWLLAKVAFGMTSISIAAVLLHFLTGDGAGPDISLSYLVFLMAGGFCFSAFGILVGFLCRTQATARTLGVLFYLPLLLPSALADFSKTLNSVAPLLPSYQFYRPVKSILLEGSVAADFFVELLMLSGFGALCLLASYLLMKRRWLM